VSPSHSAASWKGPEILAAVPADTPYMLGLIEPLAPDVRDHLFAQSGVQLERGLKKLASGEGKAALVAAALYSELDGATGRWDDVLGISSDARFVVYGLSLWPVMRLEIKDPVRVRELLARVVKAGDPDLQPTAVGRAMLYELREKGIAVVFGVVDRELVASALPAAQLDRALPAIIGTELPARSLRDATVLPELLAKHHFVAGTVGFADTHRVFEALSGHGKGQYDQLATLFDGRIPAACQDDLGRIAAAFPRVVIGYSRLDARGFAGAFTIEAPRSVTAGLAKLHAPMPAMPVKTQPLFALGAAVNLDAAVTWMKDTAGALRAAPFRCDALASLNHGIDELAAKLDQPLPPMVHGLRGFELVVDDATVLPPSGNAHLLVVGDHMADVVHGLLAQVPQLASLQVPASGAAMELPLSLLGVPASIKSAHFALRPTRAVVTVGDDSAARATGLIAAPDAHVPLMTMAFDLPKLRDRFGAFMKNMDFDNFSNLDSGMLSLDAGDEGIVLEMVGTWTHGR
jgi:hypothetical protein